MTVTALKEHSSWVALATPPVGVHLGREEGRLSVVEFRSILQRTDIRRPIDDPDRLAAMLRHANLVVTARTSAGELIGVARSLTDFSYACYLSDLCVDEAWQGRGIGRSLVAETKRIVGPQSMLLLLSARKPMGYYPRIGMEPVSNGFIINRDD